MNTLEEKKRFMRDYWLDSLSDNQIEILETEWFASDADAELLEIVRGDLIEDYLTNHLGGAELEKFKKYFLINNLEEVALAKSYLEIGETPQEKAARAGFFETLAAGWREFIKMPQIAAAGAAAALLLVGAAAFIGFYNSAPADVARNETPEFDRAYNNQTGINPPAATTAAQNETNPAVADNTTASDAPNNQPASGGETEKPAPSVKSKTASEKIPEKSAPRVAAQPQILFLTNFRGSVKTLKLAGENKNFSLRLDMPGIDKAYKNYEVRIYDSGNNLVVQHKLNENLSLRKSGAKIEIRNLSKVKFKKNDTYKTYLIGYDEKNNAAELSLYDSFKVN